MISVSFSFNIPPLGIGLAMACAVKVKISSRTLFEPQLNTLDKGYSVIITLPHKMSLVRSRAHLM